MKIGPAPQWLHRARELFALAKGHCKPSFVCKRSGQTAQLYLYDSIGKDPWTDSGIDPTEVVTALAEARGASSLEVYINSPGGYVFDGIAIYNAIRSFDGPKTVYVDGVAASIASIIALAGDRVVTNEGAMWMVHDPMGGVMSFGTADAIEDDTRKTVQALRKVRENLLDVYVSATGRGLSEVSAWMTSETWMTAAEALERGFTDEVATAPKQAAESPATAPRKASAVSPRVTVDLARAQARALSERFPGASPGATPGKPGTTKQPTARSPR
jgi:ATP-dependent Clp protease protease subunit